MRIKKIFLVFIVLFISDAAYSQTNQELFDKGKNAFRSDNFEEANKYFAEILNKESNSYDNCFYKAMVYDINFDYDRAVSECTSAIDFAPKQKEVYFLRGTIYDKQQKYEEAIKDFTQAIKLDKNYTDAYFNRASDYQELKQNNEAVKDYSKAIKLNPSDDIAYYNRGKIYMEMKDNENAVKDFEKAIKIDKIWTNELKPLIEQLQKGQ